MEYFISIKCIKNYSNVCVYVTCVKKGFEDPCFDQPVLCLADLMPIRLYPSVHRVVEMDSVTDTFLLSNKLLVVGLVGEKYSVVVWN